MRIPGNVILQIILLIPSNGMAVCTGFSYNTLASHLFFDVKAYSR